MTEWDDGFITGLALGQELPIMPKQPTDIPIVSIRAIPPELIDLRPGDQGFITFQITPADATIPKVICRSSDVEVIIVNPFQNEGLVWTYKAVGQGSAQIIVEAVDGYGASQTVNVNVLGAIVFDTLTFSRLENNINDIMWQEGYLETQFTPIEASGKNIRVKFAENLAGMNSPYTVEDTVFDNIKRIKSSFDLSDINLNQYVSRSNDQYYDIEATDGSGIKIVNRSFSAYSGAYMTIYGTSSTYTSNINTNKTMRTGYSAYLFALTTNKAYQCLLGKRSRTITILEGEDLISIDSQYNLTALRAGTAKIEINIGTNRKETLTLTISDNAGPGNNNNAIIVDENGFEPQNNYNGWLLEPSRRYRVLSGVGAREITLENIDASRLDIDGDWIVPKAVGNCQFRYKRYETYREGYSEEYRSNNDGINIYANNIACGTVESQYLKEGIAVWYAANGQPGPSNKANKQRIDVIYNTSELQQIGNELYIGNLRPTTLTFKNDGANKTSISNIRAPHVICFKKLTGLPVKIRFQNHDFPDVYDEVTI